MSKWTSVVVEFGAYFGLTEAESVALLRVSDTESWIVALVEEWQHHMDMVDYYDSLARHMASADSWYIS